MKDAKQAANKMLGIFLVLSLVITMMAGCSQSSGTKSDQTTQEQQSTTASEPLKVKRISLLRDATTMAVGVATGAIGEYLAKYGIELENIQYSKELMQSMLASGNIPDLVRFNNSADYLTAVKAGMLLNVDEHLDSIPNMVKYSQPGMKYMRDNLSNGTGKLYGVPGSASPNIYLNSFDGTAINVRWDIYKAIGAPKVSTLEDLIPVLTAMQKYYPKTESGKKTYAFGLFAEWDGSTMQSTLSPLSILGYAGTESARNQYCVTVDYKVDGAKIKPIFDNDSAYHRVLKFINALNKNGLMDPDSITQKFATVTEKMKDGAYLAGWGSNNIKEYNVSEHIDAENPTGYQPIMFDDYKPTIDYGTTMFQHNTQIFTISKNAKNIDTCLAYANLICSPEAAWDNEAGPQGEFWDIDKNGKVYATDWYFECIKNGSLVYKNGQPKINLFERLNFRYTNNDPRYGIPARMIYWDDVTKKSNKSKLEKQWSELYGYENPIAMLEAKNKITKAPIASSFLPTIPDDLTSTVNSIKTVVIDASWRMAYAESDKEFDKIWQKMSDDAYALGAQKVIDWFTKAWKEAKLLAEKYK